MAGSTIVTTLGRSPRPQSRRAVLTAALALVAPLVIVGPAAGADSDPPQPARPAEAAASFYGSPGPDRAAQSTATSAVKPAARDAVSRSRAPGTAQDSGAGRVLLSPTTTGGDDWCAQTAPGSPGTRGAAVDLSAAHATAREFSVASPYGPSDSALAEALDGADALGTGLSTATAAYADALDDVCQLPATAATLSPAQVQSSNRVARVTPGTGPVVLPPDTEIVVVDLRGLPAVAGLRTALERAVSPALARRRSSPGHCARPGGPGSPART